MREAPTTQVAYCQPSDSTDHTSPGGAFTIRVTTGLWASSVRPTATWDIPTSGCWRVGWPPHHDDPADLLATSARCCRYPPARVLHVPGWKTGGRDPFPGSVAPQQVRAARRSASAGRPAI